MSSLFRLDSAQVERHLRRADPRLGEVIRQAGRFSLARQPARTTFSALARSIVYQQLNGRAAATIFGRVEALFPGGRLGEPERVLGLAPAALRGAGLSQAKMLAIQDLARRTVAGEVPSLARLRHMGDEEIVEALTKVRGVGRWTVEMLLVFRLGRPDVLPVADFGVRKGFMLAHRKRRLPTTAELERHGERWRPYRSVAAWYLWRAVDLASIDRG